MTDVLKYVSQSNTKMSETDQGVKLDPFLDLQEDLKKKETGVILLKY